MISDKLPLLSKKSHISSKGANAFTITLPTRSCECNPSKGNRTVIYFQTENQDLFIVKDSSFNPLEILPIGAGN